MNESIKNAAKEIVEKISQLPKDSEFRFGTYFKEYGFKTNENFELFKEVRLLCESQGIVLENTQAEMMLGMPWAFKYKKKN